MDHVPYPGLLKIPAITVPYVGTYEVDHGHFATLDWQLGIDVIELSLHEYARLGQTWLYFGFLEAFIGESIHRKMFLRTPRPSETIGTEYLLDSSPLPDLLDGCVRRFRKMAHQQDRGKQLRHWSATLGTAQKNILQLERSCQNYNIRGDEVCAAIFLSIRVLEVTLRDFYFRMDYVRSAKELNWAGYPTAMNERMPGYRSVLQYGYHDEAGPGARLLMRRMKDAGWCPHQSSLFLGITDYIVAYYLSSIPRIEDVTHNKCTEKRCIAYNTNNATYVTKHVGNGCQCHVTEVSEQAINGIISTDGVPLVHIQKGSNGQHHLAVVECMPDTEYTAISHVWIDRLGNPHANGLPSCQIGKLAEHLVELQRSQQSFLRRFLRAIWRPKPKTPLVWMDTLCVPVKNEHRHLRAKAINSMSLIYAGAKQVLILDDELRRIDSKDEPVELVHARMFASKWNSRSWTLQEGALAQNVYFQFREQARHLKFPEQAYLNSFLTLARRVLESPRWFIVCAYSYQANLAGKWAWPMFFKNPAPSGYQKMAYYLQRSFHILASTHFDLQIPSETTRLSGWTVRLLTSQLTFLSLRYKFERTWNMLGQRTTTMAEDLHVIISNLTGFSVSQIMELPTPTERTKAILDRIGEFNVGCLCNQYVRPLESKDSSDRWIPAFPAPDQLKGYATLVIEQRGVTFHQDTKEEDLEAFLIENPESLGSFWIEKIQPCKSLNCPCRNNDMENEYANPEMQPSQPEDGLLENGENSHTPEHQVTLDTCLQEQQSSCMVESTLGVSTRRSFSFNSEGKHFIHEWYYITCSPPDNDELERSRYKENKTCILLISPTTNGPRTKLRGARLLETGRLETDSKVHLRYDCPLEYSVHSSAPSQDISEEIPIIAVTRSLSHSDIVIEYQSDLNIKDKFFARDDNFFYQSPFGPMGFMVLFISVIVLGVALLIGFAIVQGTFMRHRSTAARYGVNIASAVGIILITWFTFVKVRRWARVKAFRAWKKTLRDDWRPDREDRRVKSWWERFWEWTAKDRRRGRRKKRVAEYEMVTNL